MRDNIECPGKLSNKHHTNEGKEKELEQAGENGKKEQCGKDDSMRNIGRTETSGE